jgi:hypothetical protein
VEAREGLLGIMGDLTDREDPKFEYHW